MKLFLFQCILLQKKYVEPGLPALQQLADGINVNGFLSPIRKNPDQFKPCSINSSKRFTFDDLMDLIEPNFSPKGANKYQPELNVYYYFTDTLEELDQLGKIFFGPALGYAILMFDSQYLLNETGTFSGEMRSLVWSGPKENFLKIQLIIRIFAPRLIKSFDNSSVIATSAVSNNNPIFQVFLKQLH